MDEHRIGLEPLLRRVWAPIGQLPLAPVRHRFVWRYLVAFVHRASGHTVWHLPTNVSIPLFEAELAAFARTVGAGWHTSLYLRVPEHVQLLFLPAYSPELQPAEHLWQLSNDALINQCFADIDELEEAQLARCVVLQQQPEVICSATLFPWWPRQLRKCQGPQAE